MRRGVLRGRCTRCEACGVAQQVHTLLKGLEKIAASADIPMLVAGDFNSVPGSAAHSLLVKRLVDPGHPVRALSSQGRVRVSVRVRVRG